MQIEYDPEMADHLATAATTRSKFCRYCGTPYESGAIECPTCTSCARKSWATVEDVREFRRPIISTLCLYFVMLATTILGYLIFKDGLSSDFAITGADTVIVLLWVACSWNHVATGIRDRGSAKWYVGAIGIAMMTFIIATVAVNVLVATTGMEVIQLTPAFRENGYGWTVIILSCCVQPAVIEELAFRGVILSSMQRAMRTRDAIFVSALLFMTIHLTVPSFPHLLLMGLALGYMRVRSGSLYPCMVLHFTHNLLCVLTESLMS